MISIPALVIASPRGYIGYKKLRRAFVADMARKKDISEGHAEYLLTDRSFYDRVKWGALLEVRR